MSLPEDVRKAVDRLTELEPCDYRTYATLRAHLLAREAEVERHVKMLADCFRMAGADPDGNEDWRIAPNALRAVTDLRRDYDEVLDWQTRCERADALLRDLLKPEAGLFPDLANRITATFRRTAVAEKLRVAVIINDATHLMNTGADLVRRVRVFDLPEEVSVFIRRNEGSYTTITLALEDHAHD